MPLPFLMTVDAAASTREMSREAQSRLPSFRVVYDNYFDFIWTCTRRFGVPRDAVDDVVQEVLIVVHARLKTVEQPASLRSWIYGVVRRTVSTYHRGRKVRTARESSSLDLGEATDPVQLTPLELALLGDELKLVWQLLGGLDPVKREVFILAEMEEMTAPEIAEAVGVPLNTVYSRLRAARQEFQDAFARAKARGKAST